MISQRSTSLLPQNEEELALELRVKKKYTRLYPNNGAPAPAAASVWANFPFHTGPGGGHGFGAPGAGLLAAGRGRLAAASGHGTGSATTTTNAPPTAPPNAQYPCCAGRHCVSKHKQCNDHRMHICTVCKLAMHGPLCARPGKEEGPHNHTCLLCDWKEKNMAHAKATNHAPSMAAAGTGVVGPPANAGGGSSRSGQARTGQGRGKRARRAKTAGRNGRNGRRANASFSSKACLDPELYTITYCTLKCMPMHEYLA